MMMLWSCNIRFFEWRLCISMCHETYVPDFTRHSFFFSLHPFDEAVFTGNDREENKAAAPGSKKVVIL